MMNDFYEFLPLFIFLFVFYAVIIILAIVSYILRGLGILRLSSVLGVPNGWFGFIPVAHYYQLGSLAGDVELGSRRVQRPGLWLVILPVIVWVVTFAAGFGMAFSMNHYASSFYYSPYSSYGGAGLMVGFVLFYLVLIAASLFLSVLRMMVLYRIFSYFYEGQRPVFYTVLSGFVPLAEPILLMKTAKMPILYPPAYFFNRYYGAPYYQGAYPQGQSPYPPDYSGNPIPPSQPYTSPTPPPPFPGAGFDGYRTPPAPSGAASEPPHNMEDSAVPVNEPSTSPPEDMPRVDSAPSDDE